MGCACGDTKKSVDTGQRLRTHPDKPAGNERRASVHEGGQVGDLLSGEDGRGVARDDQHGTRAELIGRNQSYTAGYRRTAYAQRAEQVAAVAGQACARLERTGKLDHAQAVGVGVADEAKAREIVHPTGAKPERLARGALGAKPPQVPVARGAVLDAELHAARTDRGGVGADVRLAQPDLEGDGVYVVRVTNLVELDHEGAVGSGPDQLGGNCAARGRVEVGPEGGVTAEGAGMGGEGGAAGRHRSTAERCERVGRAIRGRAGGVEVIPTVGAQAEGGVGGAVDGHRGGRTVQTAEGEADGHRGHVVIAERDRRSAYRARDGLPGEGSLIHVEANLRAEAEDGITGVALTIAIGVGLAGVAIEGAVVGAVVDTVGVCVGTCHAGRTHGRGR